jgi:hypothetical protein
VIIGLVFARARFGGDGVVPFLGVVEFGIDIKNHATKREQAVADDLTDLKFCFVHKAHVYLNANNMKLRQGLHDLSTHGERQIGGGSQALLHGHFAQRRKAGNGTKASGAGHAEDWEI